MSWVATGVTVATAGIKYFSGKSKEKKAKADKASLATPFYDIQKEYYQNRNMAQEGAQGGMPAATKDYYTNESQKGLSAGISGILQGGGNPNDIAKIFETYDNGIAKVSSLDAQEHFDNIKTLMTANKDLAGQENTQFAINKLKPYENTLKQLNAAQAAGEATKWEGISDLTNAGISYAQSKMNNMDYGGSQDMSNDMSSGHEGKAMISSPISSPTSHSIQSPALPAHNTDSGGNSADLFNQFQQWLAQQKKI